MAARFRVLSHSYVEGFEPVDAGQVILPQEATNEQLEHALVSLSIYAPRGLDTIVQLRRGWEILDSSGQLIVELEKVS